MTEVKPFVTSLLHYLVKSMHIYFIVKNVIIFVAVNVNLGETTLSFDKYLTARTNFRLYDNVLNFSLNQNIPPVVSFCHN
jgi:hypothetical protein